MKILFLIENQIKSLTAVEIKTGVARYERQMFGYGMGRGIVRPIQSLNEKAVEKHLKNLV